jgi:hypothetical protein
MNEEKMNLRGDNEDYKRRDEGGEKNIMVVMMMMKH